MSQTVAEYHGPLFLPCGEGIKIFLQLFLVLFVFNGVICKSRIFDSVSMGRSLMYRRKRHGPKTDPWGSPEPTGMKFDLSPPKPLQPALCSRESCQSMH